MKSTAGFTLVEVLIAMLVSMLILAGGYSVFLSQQKNTTVQNNVSDVQQTLRTAMDFMARDIRMAGYSGTETMSVDIFRFRDVGFRDYDNISNPAGEGALTFNWDMDSDGILDARETVSYSLAEGSVAAPDSISLMRQLDDEIRQPMAGYIIKLGLAYAYDYTQDGQLDRDAAGNVIWAVDAGNDGVWDNLDVNGDGEIDGADLGAATSGTIVGASTGTPIRYDDIRAVRIWMLGRSEAPDPTYTDDNIYVVGRDVYQPNNNYRHRLLERTVLCRNVGMKK